MNDVMCHFSTGIHDGRVCQEVNGGWCVAEAGWLMITGGLFRMH